MNRFHRGWVIPVALAILVLSATETLADDGPNFKATFSGSAATDGSVSTFMGSGQATHLGHIATSGQAIVTGPASACAGGFANTNDETLKAPDGSSLTIRSDDVACPTGTWQFHGTGTWTVLSGTGRFARATGSGSYDGSADFIAGTFRIALSGNLAPLGHGNGGLDV